MCLEQNCCLVCFYGVCSLIPKGGCATNCDLSLFLPSEDESFACGFLGGLPLPLFFGLFDEVEAETAFGFLGGLPRLRGVGARDDAPTGDFGGLPRGLPPGTAILGGRPGPRFWGSLEINVAD